MHGLREGRFHREQAAVKSTHGKMLAGSGQGLLRSLVSLGSLLYLWAVLTSGSKCKGEMFTEEVRQPEWKLMGRLCLVKRHTELFSGQACHGECGCLIETDVSTSKPRPGLYPHGSYFPCLWTSLNLQKVVLGYWIILTTPSLGVYWLHRIIPLEMVRCCWYTVFSLPIMSEVVSRDLISV